MERCVFQGLCGIHDALIGFCLFVVIREDPGTFFLQESLFIQNFFELTAIGGRVIRGLFQQCLELLLQHPQPVFNISQAHRAAGGWDDLRFHGIRDLTNQANMMIPFASSLVLGIPMMLYFSKIKKFGMVLITYIIYGAILTLAGVGIYSLIAGTLCALIAEFILKAKRYASTSAAILSYAVCSVGANANVLGFAFMTEAQLAEKTSYYGQEYMDIISGYFSHGYMLPLLAITAFAGGALGGLLGKAVLKKHFAKSGMI